MFLIDFTSSGRLEFTASEQMTPQMERIIEAFRDEVRRGDLSPVFEDLREAEDYLLKNEDTVHKELQKEL